MLGLSALLTGCIIFDKKSEAVTFHQLASPAAVTTRSAPILFVPRAIIPSALRRPNVVLIDDTGWVRIEDAHRWIAPLDRAIPEAVGRHLTSLTGLPSSTQSPAEEHLVLLLTVDKMEVFTPADEHVIHSRDEPERALLVAAEDVTRRVPTIRGQHLLSLVWQIKIALHGGRRLMYQLTVLG